MRDAATERKEGLESLHKPARDGIWIALVTGSSILFSLALACATPFAAIATVAGTKMARPDALILIGIALLANQAMGYLVMGYPQTWDSFAWGGVIGVAALVATLTASEIARLRSAPVISLVAAFLAAFAAYQLVLFAATVVLPSGEGAFTIDVVARIFGINLLALAGLLLLFHGAVALGVLAARPADLSRAHS